MVHDSRRVESIRTATADKLKIVGLMELQVKHKGFEEQIKAVRFNLNGIESRFLAPLRTQERTPAREAAWLDIAEHLLGTTIIELEHLQAKVARRSFGSEDRLLSMGSRRAAIQPPNPNP